MRFPFIAAAGLSLALLALSACSRRPATPEDFAREILAALASNDQKEFEEVALIDLDELLDAVRDMAEENGTPPEKLKEVESILREGNAESLPEIRESFAEVRQDGEEDGVDWSDVEISGVDYEIEIEDEEGLVAQQIDRLTVRFRSNGKNFQFVVRFCAYLDNLGYWFCSRRGLDWEGAQ